MAILIGDTAPDFTLDSTEGPIHFHDYIDGAWAVLFSHPKNFTPVCTTELGYTAKLKGEVARLYDMIHPNADNTLTVRSVFVIGPDKKVKLKIEYPASTGRNFDEVIRVIDSLQLTAKHQVATPVNWKNGEDVIIVPAVTNEAAKAKYPEGWKELKPYLRIVPQPRA
jgi:alkyl hydroperoxide reductase subunit AhpC